MAADRGLAALNAFFAAFANEDVDQDRISIDSNAHCVHRCVPVCTRNGLADDLRGCFVRCRDRCLEELADEAMHPLGRPLVHQSSLHATTTVTDDGPSFLHLFAALSVVITLVAAFYIVERRNVINFRSWVMKRVKHERFE